MTKGLSTPLKHLFFNRRHLLKIIVSFVKFNQNTIEGLRAKKGVYRILAEFHFLQDQANFWHRSVIVSVDLHFVLQKKRMPKNSAFLWRPFVQQKQKKPFEALNRADVNLFCRDTGSKQGRQIFFLSVSLLISKTNWKHFFIENMQSKLLKDSKDSLIKMPLHAKLSLFAYVISGQRSSNRPKKLRNDSFQVKTSQSAKT